MEFECDDCSEQFEVIWDNDDKAPNYCPFCGGLITPGWDDEDEEEELEYDDE